MDAHMTSLYRSSAPVSARYHHNPSIIVSNHALICLPRPSRASSQGPKTHHAQPITVSTSNYNNTVDRIILKEKNLSKIRNVKVQDQENLRTRDYVELIQKSYEGNISSSEKTQILNQAPTWQSALSLFRWFQASEDYKPHTTHYNVMLRHLGRARCWGQLKFLWDEIGETKLTPTIFTYNILIDVYGKAGRLAEASVTFSDMLKSGISPDGVTLNTLIHICGTYSGNLEEAESLMNKMEERGYKLTAFTYTTLIALHCKKGNMDMALDYFSRMKQGGVRPAECTYKVLLFPLCANHMIWEVESIVNGIDGLRNHGDCLSPNIVRMCVEMRLLRKAWYWFERFHHLGGIGFKSYAAIIDAFGEHGHWLQAEKVFRCCLKTEKKQSVLEYTVMIKAYGLAKKYGKARDLFERMERYGILPDETAYDSFVQMLAAADLPDDARRYMIKMREVGFLPMSKTFNAVCAAYVRLRRSVEVEMTYKVMITLGVEPDIVTYGTLINAFAEVGNMEKAVHYFDIMEEVGIAVDHVVYISLIKGYRKVGWLKSAQKAYAKMRELFAYRKLNLQSKFQ